MNRLITRTASAPETCSRKMSEKLVPERCPRPRHVFKQRVQEMCFKDVSKKHVQKICSRNMFQETCQRNLFKKCIQNTCSRMLEKRVKKSDQETLPRNVHKKCVQETCSRNTCALHKLRFVSNTGCRTRRFSKMCPMNGFQRCLHKKCVRAMDKSVHATTDYFMLLSSLGGIHSTCFALGLVAAMRFCFMCLLNVS